MLPLAEADLSTAHGVQNTQVELGRSQRLSTGYVCCVIEDQLVLRRVLKPIKSLGQYLMHLAY